MLPLLSLPAGSANYSPENDYDYEAAIAMIASLTPPPPPSSSTASLLAPVYVSGPGQRRPNNKKANLARWKEENESDPFGESGGGSHYHSNRSREAELLRRQKDVHDLTSSCFSHVAILPGRRYFFSAPVKELVLDTHSFSQFQPAEGDQLSSQIRTPLGTVWVHPCNAAVGHYLDTREFTGSVKSGFRNVGRDFSFIFSQPQNNAPNQPRSS